MSAALPEVDVVIPAFNEQGHVDDCLDHVLAQDYPAELVRIWVVDAGSTDDTAAIVRRRAKREPRVRLVVGGRRLNAAEAVNLGVEQGRAPIVARVDAHTYPYPDYLTRAVEALDAEGRDVACVGAQPEQVGDTAFGEAVSIARRSPFGVGASVYAEKRTRAYVDTVQAGVYRRSALDAVGGFATTMLVGEDEELNWRLRKAGYSLLIDTAIRFRYTTRSTWRAVFRQHRNYGLSRVRVIAAHPDFLRPYHLAPAALVGAGALMALASPGSGAARRGLVGLGAAYALAAGAAATVAARGESSSLAPRVVGCFSALHLGYGVGLIEGAGQWLRGRLRLGDPPAAVRRR